jgi:multiple sugar transport system substrate-binding protein
MIGPRKAERKSGIEALDYRSATCRTERRLKAVDAIHCLLRFANWRRPLSTGRLVRVLPIFATTTLGLLSLTSCGYLSSDNQPGKIRLTVWSMWSGQEEKNFQQVLDRYQQLHPNISIENLGAVNDDTKTVRAIVAGVPPDLCTLSDPFFLGPLATNGAIYPLDEWFAKSGLQEKDFISASLRQCRFKDRLYAMPFLIDCMALLYNKKLFRDAHLDPERPPRTTEEMEAIAVELTASDANGINRLGLMPVTDENMISQMFGGQLYDAKTNQVTPDHEGNLAALKWYAGLIGKMGGYQKVNEFSSGFGKDQSANNPFFMGKVAMMLNGEWNPRWCDKYAPSLDYGVAPLPYPSNRPELARSTWLGGNVFCIPKGGKHPKEAWELLVWMQTDEAQILLASLNNNIPNRRSALKSPQLREGAPYKQKFAVYLDLADTHNAGSFPVLPVANMYSNELVTARELVLTGEKQPEEALRDVRMRVQRELNKYK